MKNIITLFFLFLFSITWAEEDASYELKDYEIKGDSIYLGENEVYLLEDFYVDHPDLRNYIEGKEKIKNEIKEDKKSEAEYKFDKSWKFYLLIFIFPAILILFGILYLKSRKKA